MKIGGATSDDLANQATIQNPPDVDSDYTGQPDASLDIDSSMDEFSFGIGGMGVGGGMAPMNGGSAGGLDSIANSGGITFGVPTPGQTGFGTPAQQQQPQKKDVSDAIFSAIGAGGKTSLNFTIEFLKSFKNRNIDDWALIGNLWLKFGTVVAGAGFIFTIIGIIGNIGFLKLGGMGGAALLSGLLTLASGLFALGLSTFLRASGGDFAETGGSFDNLPEFEEANVTQGGFESLSDDSDDDYSYEDDDDDSDYDSLLDSMGLLGDDDELDKMFSEPEQVEPTPAAPTNTDYNSIIDSVPSNVPIVTRRMLWDIFKPFFPTLTKGFADKKELDLMSESALQIGAGLNKAMEILFPKAEAPDIECKLAKVVETFYCYEVTFNRPKVKVKAEELQREATNIFRESPEDLSEVKIVTVGVNFIATIPKGTATAVTIGDVFTIKAVEDYFNKKTFPFIAGIGELGEVELLDARKITSMLIAGKPRSGKSSYVSSILLSLCTMNTPEDIQFLIIDPKDSMLFFTYALLPHVCGRHNDNEALAILKAVLYGEGERRKQLLRSNGVENIWELRERKNIKLPMLYVVIDEAVTLMANADQKGIKKDIQNLIDSILTQLPSSGIGLIMIPHRSTGILSPTTRLNIAFKAAVMADKDVVEEELGIKRWQVPLTRPGEIAVKETSYQSAKFVRGSCPVDPSLSDADYRTRELICNIARTWYKLGVELPDMSALGVAYNRDEQKIREELEITLNPDKIQYELDIDGYRTN